MWQGTFIGLWPWWTTLDYQTQMDVLAVALNYNTNMLQQALLMNYMNVTSNVYNYAEGS